MFPSSAFSAVSSHPDDPRANQSTSAVHSPLTERARIGHRLLTDQPPSNVGQYNHLVNPVAYPPG